MTQPRGQQDGPQIQRFREKRGLSRRELADRIGLSHEQTLTNIELGNKPASIRMLTKIAAALGVQIVDVVKCDTPLHDALTQANTGSAA